MLIAKIL